MNAPVWAANLATKFWHEAGEIEPFPRNLRRPIAQAVPLTVVLLPRLTVVAIVDWLKANQIACDLDAAERPLRGCLVARDGHGIAFVDGSDDEAEQRFSLAHELAHFLRDYWHVRQQVERRLGPAAIAAVDGRRLPTTNERLQALLTRTTFHLAIHLMERDAVGRFVSNTTGDSEECADRLAFELLAPAADVARHVAGDQRALVLALTRYYGLPESQAARYGELLMPTAHRHPLIRRLQAR